MIKKLNNWTNRNSEILMIIAWYLFSFLIIFIAIKIALRINLFPIEILNTLTGIILFWIVFFFSLNILIKIITWVNLKAKTPNKKFEEKEKKGELDEEVIKFNNWLEFFIFSITIIGTEYLNFFWTLKISLKLLSEKTKEEAKGNKVTGFYWGKSKSPKTAFILCGYLIKPKKQSK
jgi:hypothetical protein